MYKRNVCCVSLFFIFILKNIFWNRRQYLSEIFLLKGKNIFGKGKKCFPAIPPFFTLWIYSPVPDVDPYFGNMTEMMISGSLSLSLSLMKDSQAFTPFSRMFSKL